MHSLNCHHREQEVVHCHVIAPFITKWLLHVASWGWCRCSYRQNSGPIYRDASHSAGIRRRWYRFFSVTLLSHKSRWQWLVLSARAKSQLQREQSLEHPKSEGGAWPGRLPQHFAILGCDTTSRPYGIGKAASLKKYGESVYFQDQAKVFDIPGSTQAEVATAGENALVVLFGGKQGESLDSLRYLRCYEKVATRGQQIQPQNLPRHPQQADTKAVLSFYRPNSGSVLVRGCSVKTGAGSLAVTRWLPWPLIYRLFQSPCSRWSAATVQLTVSLQGAPAVSMD